MSDRVPPLPRLAESTLLLIDWQEEYRTGALVLDGVEPAIARAAETLERARTAGRGWSTSHTRELPAPCSIARMRVVRS